MQKVAWPSTIVQNENGISMMLKAERSAMPVMMPGSAIGRMTSSEIASRPKKLVRRGRRRERAEHHGERSRPPRPGATARARARRRPAPGHGEPFQRQARRRELVALLLGGEGVEEDQRERQVQEQEPAPPRQVAADRPQGGRLRSGSERIEGPHALGDGEVDRHDDDRHHREGGGERDVARRALERVDGLADEQRRVPTICGMM
jgi:hypothetical protein